MFEEGNEIQMKSYIVLLLTVMSFVTGYNCGRCRDIPREIITPSAEWQEPVPETVPDCSVSMSPNLVAGFEDEETSSIYLQDWSVPVVMGNNLMSEPQIIPKTPQYDINSRYPVIEGMHDKKAQKTINIKFQECISGKKYFIQMLKKISNAGYSTQDYSSYVSRNKNGIVCINIDYSMTLSSIYQDIAVRESVIFNAETGRIYSRLDDIFRLDSKWKPVLGNLAKTRIEEMAKVYRISLFKQYQGIFGYKGFYLTNDKLVLFYDLNEIVSFSDSNFSEIDIPIENLKGLLLKEFC
jgi:hypothetical protein